MANIKRIIDIEIILKKINNTQSNEEEAFFQEWINTMKYLYSFVLDEADAKEKAEFIVAEIEGSVLMMKLLDDVNYLQRTNERLLKEYKELERQKVYK